MKVLLIILGLFFCGEVTSVVVPSDDCWEGRETIKELLNQEGVIKRESNQAAIVLPSSRKLFPCNLPDSYQTGDSVLFSANQKEVFPNERWEGRPVELTCIEHKKLSIR